MARKKEIIETFRIDVTNLVDDAQSLLGDIADSANQPVLELNIDAAHSGRLTNDRVYPGIHVRDSVSTFMKPTPRPVLKNHNDRDDPIGRVTKADFIQLKKGRAFEQDYLRPSTGTGSGLIQLDIDIMDFDAAQKFLDGRFKEFSTRQHFDSMLCSVCGNDFTKGYCGHYPGDTVIVESKKKGGKDKEFQVFGITGPLIYREVSVVNIPGDAFTKINEMQAAQDSLEDDFVITVCDDSIHDISKIVLSTDAGAASVDLLRSGNRQAVTAEDRKTLTNKSIFCVAGPDFQLPKENTEMKETEEKEDVTEDVEEKNTSVVEDQLDDKGESSQETEETEAEKEGVVAPDGEGTDENDETNSVSDEEVQDASIEALVLASKGLKRDLKDSRTEIERLKGEATKQDEETERLRESASDAQAKLNELTARQLLDIKLILGKADVEDVKDAKSYDEKLAELTKRTLDSLNDAIADIKPELIEFKSNRGITEIAKDTQIEDPQNDGTPNVVEKPKKEVKDEKKPKATRKDIIDAQLT